MPLADRFPTLLRLAQRLEDRADGDPAFRALLLDLADALAEIAGPDLAPAEAAEGSGEPALLTPPARDATAPEADAPTGDALPSGPIEVAPTADLLAGTGAPDAATDDALGRLAEHFRQGGFVPAPEAPPALSRRNVPDAVLGRLARRLALKAEAAQRAARPAATDLPSVDALRSRAGDLKPCALWMLDPGAPAADRLAALPAAFRVAAEATALLATLAQDTPPDSAFRQAVEWAAEAQSMLRAAFHAAHERDAAATYADDEPDQMALFTWLRETTSQDQIFVRRHMKRSDPAHPAGADALSDQIRALTARIAPPESPRAARRKSAEKAFKVVAYHTRQIERGSLDPAHDLRRIGEAVGQVLASGLPLTDTALRDAVAPLRACLPDGLAPTPDLARILADLDALDIAEDEPADPDEPLSPEVAAVATLLRGRTVAFFGGVPKRHVAERIEHAFGVTVTWTQTREHQPTAPFETVVRREDVALVVLFIRWCSHSFEALKGYCEASGTPYVRVPAGNHPNRIARIVLEQAGDTLAASA